MDAGGVKPAGHLPPVRGKEDDQKMRLLSPAMKRAGRRRKSFKKRRVQWNDRNGRKLEQVLEFQPSDSSDSEDEYMDSCICNIM